MGNIDNYNWNSIYSADVIEFMSLAAHYCDTVEHINEDSSADALRHLQSLLISLYQKALALYGIKMSCDDEIEEYVTEDQYNYVREQISLKLGAKDDYLDVFIEDMKYSDKPILKTISEDLADIYQAIGNFVAACQTEVDEIMYCALHEVVNSFEAYWGGRLLSATRALHELLISNTEDFD